MEGFIHLIDAKDEFKEEVGKGLLRPLETSTNLYRISTLRSKVENLISTLKLALRAYPESFYREELPKFSLIDAEAFADSIERATAPLSEAALEKIRNEYGDKLCKLEALLRVVEALESAKAKIAETSTTAVFVGWIPKNSLQRLSKVVEESTNGQGVVRYEEPQIHFEEPVSRESEKGEREVSTLRFYIPKKHLDDVVYALTGIYHQVVDLREFMQAEFKEKVKPLEPSPKLFRLSSLSSRLDVVLSSLGLSVPKDIKPVSTPLRGEEIEEMEAFLSPIEGEVFSITSKLEGIKRSMDAASKIESEVSTIVLPQVPSTEMLLRDVKGPIRSVVLQLTDETAKLHAYLNKIRAEKGDQLVELKRKVEGARLVEEEKLKMLSTDSFIVFQVSVSKEDVEKLISRIKDATGGSFLLKEAELPRKFKAKKEVEEKHREEVKVPTLMDNPWWTKVYENIVRGFGILNYREIDPTIIWYFTFPLFFGIMFCDMGHGLVLLILSSILYHFKRKGIKGGETTNYIIQGSPILLAGAISSTFFGFLFGEFFGYIEDPVSLGHLLSGFFESEAVKSVRASVLGLLGLSGSYHFHLMDPNGARALLKLSIYIAIFHISLGLIISIVNKVRLKEYKEAIVGPGLWLWLYLSGSIAFITMGRNIFNAVFSDMMIGFVFIWLPFIVMIVARSLHLGMIDGFSESLDSFIASLSNTISYARLFAFAMIHGIITSIFTMVDRGLMDMVGVPLYIGAIAGTLFFVFFEIIFVFLQALRLHWVEHGLKFLVADGVRFQPFTIEK
ncbi:MAG: V-type ATPase 116kDa subunit family protein [Candidatus Nezhaarchaeota archaeon]|nr:V-type ATPase 116kDa subunit family protein [Candidatus Nezhaarchaeota archaeon]